MGRATLPGIVIRMLLAALFLGIAWFTAGQAVTMGLLGESSQATVIDYWERESPVPMHWVTDADEPRPVVEPTVRIASGRQPAECHTVYRGLQRKRELPGRGAQFEVMFRPDTLGNCIARSTAFSKLHLGVGGIFALIGLSLAGSVVSRLAL